MCGIVGIYRYDSRREEDTFYVDLVNSLYHRGPDGGGYWTDGPFFLGHRRLSIIDLTTGDQPMGLPEGDLVISFNGEIYNYVELRKELLGIGHVFTTTSDTEVLLHGYREWGTGLPARLIGMFAFAIVDRKMQTLFLARDRFGEKPLFLIEQNNYVAFASEIKTFTLLNDFERKVHIRSLEAYLCLNYVPGEDTLMEGVKRLQPGSWALYSADGRKRQESFYEFVIAGGEALLTEGNTSFASIDSASEALLHLIDESVRITLRSDVPVGIFLSGGIDSAIIAHSAVRHGKLNKAFCITFADQRFSELDKARHVADSLGIELENIELGSRDIENFFELVQHADDPMADSSCLPMYILSRFAAQSNKVVLGGDGGDEIFGGYLTYKATLLHQKIISRFPRVMRKAFKKISTLIPLNEGKVSINYKLMRFLRAADLSSELAHFSWNGTWLPNDAAGFVNREFLDLGTVGNPLDMIFRDFGISGRFTLRDLQLIDIDNYLANDILVKVDRMSMAHGLELRAPFLHPAIAEFGLALEQKFKFSRKGTLKYILRKITDDLFGKKISAAGKQGFSIPIHAWLRRTGRPIMTDLLSVNSIKQIPELNFAPIEKAVQEHLEGKKSLGYELWGLMALVEWHRSRITSRYADIKKSYVQKKEMISIPT